MDGSKVQVYLGIDVSKASLDICWQGKVVKITNEATSICDFIRTQLGEMTSQIFCVLESTGGYERLVVELLSKANIAVHVAHPSRVHAFAKACGHLAKTDKLDAILLAKYAQFIGREEKRVIILDAKQQAISNLRRLARSIERNLHAAQCRSKQMPAGCQLYLQQEIVFHQAQLAAIQAEIEGHINHQRELQAKRNILVTMQGVGEKTASILLAELPELGTVSRTQIASLAGVAPRSHQSGKKIGKAMIVGGRFYARKALYMVALVAAYHNPLLKQQYQAMLQQGKAKKVALVAIMRKIIVMLNAMLKNMQPYHFSA